MDSRTPTTVITATIWTTEANQLASPSSYKYKYKYKCIVGKLWVRDVSYRIYGSTMLMFKYSL